MTNWTGLVLPGLKETGAPEGAPAQPVITEIAGTTGLHKKTRRRVLCASSQRETNPGNGFCRCPRSIAQQRDTNQPQ
ncbi:hypothetical protein MC64_012385 [Aeromonas caviae]|nr:hypothetical protein MC64_012385 [Aeromonas caviae]